MSQEVNLLKYLLQYWSQSQSLSVVFTSIENVRAVKQCFIEINLSSAECVMESKNRALVLYHSKKSVYYENGLYVCEIR